MVRVITIFSRLLLNFLLSIAVIIMLLHGTMLGIKFTLAPFAAHWASLYGFASRTPFMRVTSKPATFGRDGWSLHALNTRGENNLPDERGIGDFVRLPNRFLPTVCVWHCVDSLKRKFWAAILTEALQKVVKLHSPLITVSYCC